MASNEFCECGSGQPSASCCAAYLAGQRLPPSAEALMRSRYVAYVQLNEPYLLATWHSTTRPASLELAQSPQPRWLGLAVKRHETQGDDRAIVEFVARYKVGGRAYRLHETSRFVREAGQWFYVDGDVAE